MDARADVLPPAECAFCGGTAWLRPVAGLNKHVNFTCGTCKAVYTSDMTNFYDVLYTPVECGDTDVLGTWRAVRRMSPDDFVAKLSSLSQEAVQKLRHCTFCSNEATFIGLGFELNIKRPQLWQHSPFYSRWQCNDPMCRGIALYNFSNRTKVKKTKSS